MLNNIPLELKDKFIGHDRAAAGGSQATDLESLWNLPAAALARVWRTLYVWQRRTDERRALAELDDRLRADISRSPRRIAEEIAKPFWRA